MVLSSSERDDLVQRVERTLERSRSRARVPRVSREVIRDAVDRTLGALPAEGRAAEDVVSSGEGTAVLAAVSIPDLASRARRAMEQAGMTVSALATATEGRYTVVTLQVPLAAAAQVRAAAQALGARFSWRGDGR